MSRIILIILAITLLYGVAIAESTFQGIPWMSNNETTIDALIKAGFIYGNPEYHLINDRAIVLVENEELNYQPVFLPEYNSYLYTINLSNSVKGKIAGYPIRNIIPTFAYDGEYKLIAVKIELLGADYTALTKKLTHVYGDGDKKTIEAEGIEAIVWRRDDNTAVLLYTESDGYEYQLIYGRTDATNILSHCMEPADPDDVSGL